MSPLPQKRNFVVISIGLVLFLMSGQVCALEAKDPQDQYSQPDLTVDNVRNVDLLQKHLSKMPTKTVVATGYTAGEESTGKAPGDPSYGITYGGVKVRRDVYSTIAADLDVFPLGTILYIPGYGYGVVADTGSAIQGNIIDLYFESVEDIYREWGKKTVDVYVIRQGDGKLSEETLDWLNEKVPALPVNLPQ